MLKKSNKHLDSKKVVYTCLGKPRHYYSFFERDFVSKKRNPYGVGLTIPSYEVRINKAINENKSLGELLAIFEEEYFLLKNNFIVAKQAAKEFFKQSVIYFTKSKNIILISKYDENGRANDLIPQDYRRYYGGVIPEFTREPYLQKHKIDKSGANFFVDTRPGGVHYFSSTKIETYSVKELDLISFRKALAYHDAYQSLMTGVIRLQSLIMDLAKHCTDAEYRIYEEAPFIPLDKVTMINGFIHENSYLRQDFGKKLNLKVEVTSVSFDGFKQPN
jgi:hypothetical protein